MCDRKRATLQMKRNYLMHDFFDDQAYLCHLIRFDQDRDMIYLTSDNHPIQYYSLDSLYTCSIEDTDCNWEAEGVIVERYENALGAVIKMEVRKGVYKKLLK